MSDDKIQIACIGAGNLTKGLLYPLFVSAGYDVAIIPLTERSCQSLRAGYTLTEIGTQTIQHEYRDIRLCRLAEIPNDGLASFQYIMTAVGSEQFAQVTEALKQKKFHPAMRLFVCENDIACFDMMRRNIPNTFPAVVDRIVYSSSQGVVAESYFLFETFMKSNSKLPECITICPDYQISYTRKLFLLNTLHAIAAWAGHAHGCAYINEACGNAAVMACLRDAAQELLTILQHKFPGISPDELQAFAQRSLARFSHAGLNDPILRVGRSALRKLGRHERIMRPLCYARQHGLPYEALLKGAAYGAFFHADLEETAMPGAYDEIFSYIETLGGDRVWA